jgi:hypothetical protein
MNSPVSPQESSPPQEHQPLIDPLPSSTIVSPSLSSSSPSKIIEASNQEDKKKKKMKSKKNQNKQGGNQETTVVRVDNIAKPTNIGPKPKFPCKLCKCDHLLNHFPSIPKVLEVWSRGSQQPMLPVDAIHDSDNPSTSDNKVGGERVKLRFLSSYAGKCTSLTFFLVWMKLRNCWNTLLFPSNNLQLLHMSPLQTNHWLIKWSVQFNHQSIPLFSWRVKWISLKFFFSIHIPLDKGEFHPFQ